MKNKPSRNRDVFTTTVDPLLLESIRDMSSQTDIPISKLIDRAIELLIIEKTNAGLYKSK